MCTQRVEEDILLCEQPEDAWLHHCASHSLRQSLIPPEARLEATKLSDPLVPTLQGTDVTSACGMPSFFLSARDGVQVLVPAQQAL